MIGLPDIRRAGELIAQAANRTPVFTSRTLDRMSGARVFLKCENFQRTGSFKFRGAYNALKNLTVEERSAGVITHSSGNHAQALALAAATEGVRARIVMPQGSSQVKREAVKGYGADVILCGDTLESRESTAAALIFAQGLTLIHPYNNERVMAGAGTAALELLEETGPLDLVITPVGGGGLLSGTAVAAKGLCPEITVWGAEPAGADDASRSFRKGEIVLQIAPRTIADGLHTSLGELTFAVIRKLVDDIVLVQEKEIVAAMRFLWERLKLVVEPSGAVPLAAVLAGRLPASGSAPLRVGLILSGGNVNLEAFFKTYSDGIS